MIHMSRCGTGDDVFVAVHGWGGSHETYAPLAPYVPATASLLAVDLPGYGRSASLGCTRAEDVAAAVLGAADTAGVDRVTLLGNCSGAIFALLVAAAADRRIARLVLIEPFAFVPWYFGIFLSRRFGRTAYYSTFANPVGRWLANATLRGRRASATHLTRSFAVVDHQVSLRYLEMLSAIGTVERFSAVRTPIDIVYGARTFQAVRRSVETWRAILPQARVWRLEGAGHLPIEDAPDRVASIVFGARAASGEPT